MNQHRPPALALVFAFLPSRRDVLRGLAGAGLWWAALQAPDPGEARRKRKRKKKKPCPPCKKRKKGKCKRRLPDGAPCPGGTCQSGTCQPSDSCPGQKPCEGTCIPTNQCCSDEDCPATGGVQCCNGVCTDEKQGAGEPCQLGQHQECCSNYCTTSATCAASCRGKSCGGDRGCCRGFACQLVGTSQDRTCGGCKDTGVVGCESDGDCCYSACNLFPVSSVKTCLSSAGEPCETNRDCYPCYVVHDCTVTTGATSRDICFNGVCGCPYECCADSDCAPAEFCAVDSIGLHGECKPRTGP